MFGSFLLENSDYDDKMREWLGSDYDMKLLYRASEQGYSGKSFHDYCDDKGPTLIIIKNSGEWIFGGYTTLGWVDGRYNDLLMINRLVSDDKAFLFPLRNSHDIPPTRYMKKKQICNWMWSYTRAVFVMELIQGRIDLLWSL